MCYYHKMHIKWAFNFMNHLDNENHENLNSTNIDETIAWCDMLSFNLTYLDIQGSTGQAQTPDYHTRRNTSSAHRSSQYCDRGRSYRGQCPGWTLTRPHTGAHWKSNLSNQWTEINHPCSIYLFWYWESFFCLEGRGL